MWSSVIAVAGAGRERGARADGAGGRPQPAPERAVRVRLALDAQVLGGDEVEQDQRAELARMTLGVGGRAAQAGLAEGALSSVASSPSNSTKRSSGAPAGRSVSAQRAGELDDGRRAGRAVVGADEARQPLGVVVRGDHDRGPGARQPADDVAQPGMAGHALEAAVAAARAAAARRAGAACASRPGAGRARPGARAPPRRAPSRSDRRAPGRAGRRAASRRRRRRARARPRRRRSRSPPRFPGSPRDAAQSFEVTASSSPAKRSRAAARRAGTCSLGTPSAGAA